MYTLKKTNIIIFGLLILLLLILYFSLFQNHNNDINNNSNRNEGSKMDISSILEELNKPEDRLSKNLILEEIYQIDIRSFDMAKRVAQNPKDREKLRDEATGLINRLDSLADKLEAEKPNLYNEVTDQISESLLDLSFVETESDVLSLRLGNYLNDAESICEKDPSQDIDKLKLAVYHFLNTSVGVDLPEAELFLHTLPEPIAEFNEVIGTFWTLKLPYAKLRLIIRDFPKVIRFSSLSAIPWEEDRPIPAEGYSEIEAKQRALDLVSSLIPDFIKRNFVLRTEHNEEFYDFNWVERPAGKIISVPPNRVTVILHRVSLKLEYYSVFDFPHGRTVPPRISKKQAEEIAQRALNEKWTVRKLMLWERVRNGGEEIRTVWTVTMSFKIPEGESLEDVVIDADTGEIIEEKSF